MATDTPALYLDKVVSLLTGTRALGPAARMRDGKGPYSVELDFRLTQPADVQRIIAWALDQAPYAHIETVGATKTPGTVTVFARVGLPDLARFLIGQTLLHTNGQTWETATGAVADMLRSAVADTVDRGDDWAGLLNGLRIEQATHGALLLMLKGSIHPPIAALVKEAIRQADLGEGHARLTEELQKQAHVLGAVLRALETGDYLPPA